MDFANQEKLQKMLPVKCNIIPPISPSIVLLGDIGERDLLPKDFPTKYEPISKATIKKQEVRVKVRPEELEKISTNLNPLDVLLTDNSNALNLIQ